MVDKCLEGKRRWRRKRLMFRLGSLGGSLIVALAMSEAALRIVLPRNYLLPQDDARLLYNYDAELGWFPAPNSTNLLTAARTVGIEHNSWGFRDSDPPLKSSRPRIMFLGDSFVWGMDVERSERFTDKLRNLHPEWDIYNMGVSGYGTDQEFLLLQRWFDRMQPTVVFLVFCSDNDHEDDSSNVQPGGYYKPYYTCGGDGLKLSGVPVPRSERLFYARHKILSTFFLARAGVRAWCRLALPRPIHNPDPTALLILTMRDFVLGKGARFAVGVEGPELPMNKLLETCGVPCVDLSVDRSGRYRYETFGAHWTPEGHEFVCRKVESLLKKVLAAPKDSAEITTGPRADAALAEYHASLGATVANVGETRWAIEEYREAIRLRPEFPEALNNLAWILSTHWDSRLRNGRAAVELSQRACRLTSNSVVVMVGTAAAACAEAGQFSNAVNLAEQACALAEHQNRIDLLERNTNLLDLYRSGKPYHESCP